MDLQRSGLPNLQAWLEELSDRLSKGAEKKLWNAIKEGRPEKVRFTPPKQIAGKSAVKMTNKTRMRRYVSWFGAEPVFLAIAWRKLGKSGWLKFAGRQPNPKHLLWAFMWAKGYQTEDVGAGICGVDEKTYREKVWFYLEGLARLMKRW